MNEGLKFEDPVDFQGKFLPYNYFPAAFGIAAGAPDVMNRIVMMLPGEGASRRAAVKYHVVSAENLKNPVGLQKFLSEREFDPDTVHKRCFLGPPTRLEETAADRPISFEFAPLQVAEGEPITQVGVIIDIGIAYWNAAFQSKNGPRFKSMHYLDFDAYKRGAPALEELPYGQIEAHCNIANNPGGQESIVADLGRRFPDSYFGNHGSAEPGTLWHGTAMADLMAGLPKDAPDNTVLMGIELPMAVLRDSDGDNLGLVLATLLEGAMEITATQFSGVPLVIALPWGFTSGPQDGSHPFAIEINRVLALHPSRAVTLLVPMGNQMQDRCCGHILPSDAGEPEGAVIWRIPPDDFSENSAEFNVVKTGQTNQPMVQTKQTVRITAPTGQTAVILLEQGWGVFISLNGVLIGVILRALDTAFGPRLRMTLAPTGWRPGAPKPGLAGDWVLSFNSSDEARIWVLRDDRDWSLDKAWPRRASHLFDPNYRARDHHDAYLLTDDPASAVVRSGTASVLATATMVKAVQADEVLGAATARPASYSGVRTSMKAAEISEAVDMGRHGAGLLAAANGTGQKMRVSSTSVAIAVAARNVLGLPARPL